MRNKLLSPPPVAPHSPWRSPVPFLFGGLAAMLGLVVLSLLILSYSYCRRFSCGDDGRRAEDKPVNDAGNAARAMEEKVLVIMAGEDKPTFLATPVPGAAEAAASFLASKKKSEKRNDDREPKQETGNSTSHTVDTQNTQNQNQ